jgi:4-amino-4-deoxy-L-arabinose transferase-like glycosyltransferase
VIRPTRHSLVLLLVLLAGLALRVWGIRFGFPHPMTRPDEEFIVGVALGFFSGDFNPHFFEWPSLYFYVVHGALRTVYVLGRAAGAHPDAAAFAAGVTRDPEWAHLTLRMFSVAAGTGTLLVVHRLGRRLFDPLTGLAAAALLAVAYLHVRDSHFGVLDVPLTLLVVLTIAILARAWQEERVGRWFAIAGLVAGLATSIKYNASALVVAAGVTAAIRMRDDRGARTRTTLALAIFFAVFALGFVAGTPYAVLDSSAFREGLSAQVVRLTEGHGIRIERVWERHLTFSLLHGVGWPVLVAGLAGLAWLAIVDWRKWAIAFSFPLAYFVVVGGGHTAFIRYVTPLVPFLCLAAAFATGEAARHLAPTLTGSTRRLVTAAAVLLLALPSAMTAVRFDRMLTRTDTRVEAAAWLRGEIAAGQSLYESGASYARPHYAWGSSVDFVEVELDPRTSSFVTLAGRPIEPDWIVLAESPLRLYTPVPGALRGILASRYRKVRELSPSREPEPETIFDRQDAFFLPFADFSARDRPGPTLTIYKRSP